MYQEYYLLVFLLTNLKLQDLASQNKFEGPILLRIISAGVVRNRMEKLCGNHQ